MEILKKHIDDYYKANGGSDCYIQLKQLEKWLKEFEARQRAKSSICWETQYRQACADFFKVREEVQMLEKENTHLKICVDKNIQDAVLWQQSYDDLIKNSAPYQWQANLIKKKDSPWISTDYPPTDDASVLVIHSLFPDVVHMAFYDDESKEFLSIDSSRTMAINCSHYMYLPKLGDDS